MFGVIVCSHCMLVQGADLSMARITCPRCGKSILVRRAKVYFSTDSTKELAEAVRRVGERLVYDIEVDPSSRGPMAHVGRSPLPERHSLRSTVAVWLEDGREFGRDDLLKAVPDLDGPEADRFLDQMLRDGLIYEASSGRYRPASSCGP